MISSASTQETYKKKVIQEKLDDPGSFTSTCSLGPLTFNRCLCHLGASVSLMPLSTAKRLGIMEYKFCNLALLLADGSVDQKEAYFEEKSNEYSSYRMSREDAEYDSGTENSTTEDENFSVPLLNLFFD